MGLFLWGFFFEKKTEDRGQKTEARGQRRT